MSPRSLGWIVGPAMILLATATERPAERSGTSAAPSGQTVEASDARRAFDFELGEWTIHLRRRLNPLTGSDDWVEYEGTSIVRPVWNGEANLGELDVSGPAGHIRGLSLRLFDPVSGQWRISWANSADGILGQPMIGGFTGGVGEFYNQETFNARAIFVRFIFAEITPTSFRLEQAFSVDGGKSWEANWIARFTR